MSWADCRPPTLPDQWQLPCLHSFPDFGCLPQKAWIPVSHGLGGLQSHGTVLDPAGAHFRWLTHHSSSASSLTSQPASLTASLDFFPYSMDPWTAPFCQNKLLPTSGASASGSSLCSTIKVLFVVRGEHVFKINVSNWLHLKDTFNKRRRVQNNICQAVKPTLESTLNTHMRGRIEFKNNQSSKRITSKMRENFIKWSLFNHHAMLCLLCLSCVIILIFICMYCLHHNSWVHFLGN